MQKKLIVNADDFGYSSEINRGIIEAVEFGIVKNASIMLNKPGTLEAVEYVKKKRISYGLHLNLDEFFDIEHGSGKIRGYSDPLLAISDVEAKIRKELDQFVKFGLEPKHIDSHHHAHMMPGILPAAVRVFREYKVRSMRFSKEIFYKYWHFEPESTKKAIQDAGIIVADYIIDGWYWGNLDMWPSGTAEIISHPGYGQAWREKELKVLNDRILFDHIKKSNIQLTDYSEYRAD